jgi:glycine/D-amino acid oxidase-like deaminating enzyme
MFQHETYDAVVIGGGFFGCSLASYLKRKAGRVLLAESAADFLQRASYVNQARVHNGYHYPRHFLTALRSHINFPRFVEQFRGCIYSSFEKYYAVARRFSKTTALQYRNFMERVGSPLEPAPESVVRLFNPDLIEAVFKAEECAFDAVKLKEIVVERMRASGVEAHGSAEVVRLEKADTGIRVTIRKGGQTALVLARRVYNCTYSHTNDVLGRSGVPLIPLKHEVTEMCLIRLPRELEGISVTVMCGPFFSVMPFPPRGACTLSHVRYTPHCYWYEGEGEPFSPYEYLSRIDKKTRFPAMIRDASRYLPALAGAAYEDSLWEIKTTLPASESDDGRPILFQAREELPGLTCVMGGKIDNIYDVFDEVDKTWEA